MIQDRIRWYEKVETSGIGMNNESKEPLREWEDGIYQRVRRTLCICMIAFVLPGFG